MKTAPLDGSLVLLLTSTGIVSAWFAEAEYNAHYFSAPGEEWTPPMWVCYDDEFQIHVEHQYHELYDPEGCYIHYGCLGWMPLPEGTEELWKSRGISHQS